MAKQEKQKVAVYYSKGGKYAFSMPAHDKNGNLIQRVNAQGVQRYNRRGEPEYLDVTIAFEPVVKNLSKGCVCQYVMRFEKNKDGEWEPADKWIYEKLEKLADDPSSTVMRKESWEAMVNPAAAEAQRELERVERESAERDGVNRQTIDELRRELAEAQKLIDKDKNKRQG